MISSGEGILPLPVTLLIAGMKQSFTSSLIKAGKTHAGNAKKRTEKNKFDITEFVKALATEG